MEHAHPPGHYFDFNTHCTINPNDTNRCRMSSNMVSIVVHYVLNTLFAVLKLLVANGAERPHYSKKKPYMIQQYGSLIVPA